MSLSSIQLSTLCYDAPVGSFPYAPLIHEGPWLPKDPTPPPPALRVREACPMLTTSFDAKSCPAPVILSDRPRLRTREAYTLTAVATELRFGADGRRIARLNAFVDGLGPRTVHIELGADEYDRVSRTMRSEE